MNQTRSIIITSEGEYNLREYTDENGWKVTELTTPTSHTVYKHNKRRLIYIKNSNALYEGPYDSQYLIRLLNQDHCLDLDSLIDDLKEKDSKEFTDSFENTFDDDFLSDNQKKHKTSADFSFNYGCGCCIITIVSFVLMCIILYAMGHIGMQIIDFIKSLF